MKRRKVQEDAAPVMPVAVRRAFNISEPSATAEVPGVLGAALQPLVYDLGQTAILLRVHRSTVGRLISEGALPAVRIGSRTLIKRADLDALLERLTTTGVPEALRERGEHIRAARERKRKRAATRPA